MQFLFMAAIALYNSFFGRSYCGVIFVIVVGKVRNFFVKSDRHRVSVPISGVTT